MSTQDDKAELIKIYASGSRDCLKKAFNRKAPRIAEALTSLGKPVGERTVRAMTEESKDVLRRNTLENTCLLLGACSMTGQRSFETVWSYLESCAAMLRKPPRRFQNFDQAFVELKHAYIVCERAYYQNDTETMPGALVGVEETLKDVIVHMNLKS